MTKITVSRRPVAEPMQLKITALATRDLQPLSEHTPRSTSAAVFPTYGLGSSLSSRIGFPYLNSNSTELMTKKTPFCHLEALDSIMT
jgi:hypothetical protein